MHEYIVLLLWWNSYCYALVERSKATLSIVMFWFWFTRLQSWDGRVCNRLQRKRTRCMTKVPRPKWQISISSKIHVEEIITGPKSCVPLPWSPSVEEGHLPDYQVQSRPHGGLPNKMLQAWEWGWERVQSTFQQTWVVTIHYYWWGRFGWNWRAEEDNTTCMRCVRIQSSFLRGWLCSDIFKWSAV